MYVWACAHARMQVSLDLVEKGASAELSQLLGHRLLSSDDVTSVDVTSVDVTSMDVFPSSKASKKGVPKIEVGAEDRRGR
jgi:hypothetical protein